MQKISPENFVRYREIAKNEMISFSYDVNDHVYTNLKSNQLRTDLANIEVRWILTLSWTDIDL